jgi:hypothetical protein
MNYFLQTITDAPSDATRTMLVTGISRDINVSLNLEYIFDAVASDPISMGFNY